jgi:hypothetical protein
LSVVPLAADFGAAGSTSFGQNPTFLPFATGTFGCPRIHHNPAQLSSQDFSINQFAKSKLGTPQLTSFLPADGKNMKMIGLSLALLASSPAMAEGLVSFPIAIPQECVAVAQRERLPTVMKSKVDAIQAAMKLDRLTDRDPSVLQCKQTVARLKAFL